jgi:predicted dithiol-disulfide oxidoreductase (DUF899 family)
MTAAALPPVAGTWQRQIDALRAREKAATRELDAIAAQHRRRWSDADYPWVSRDQSNWPTSSAARSQLIVYNHMWFPGERAIARAAPGSPRSSPDWSSGRRPVRHRHPGPIGEHSRTSGGPGTK